MAFWQVNTWNQWGIWNSPVGTWFSWGFPTWMSNNTKTKTTSRKSDDYTYNPRYPWFDEADYKRLEQMVRSKWVTWAKFDQLMDEAYQYYLPQVQNKHKLAERSWELNQAVYNNADAIMNGEWNSNQAIKLTQLSQKAKEKYNIPYDFPDDQLLKMMEEETEGWNKLVYDYVYNGSDEIFYKTWIYDAKQWGIKWLINPASEWWILPESWWEALNPVGAWTEIVDNAATKFADKFLDWWNMLAENSTKNLKDEIDNMSPEEVEMRRNEFKKAVWEKRIGTAYTYGDTIVERLWNGIKGDKYYPEDEEAFLKWLIDKKANLWQSLVGADDILKWESNPNVVQFFANIPSSALKTFTSTVRWMTNPYDTFKWLYKLALTPEWHEALLQRYGSWDALANAMNTDPVGVADDILAVAELWTNIVWWWLKFTWKVTGNSNLVNMWTNIKWSIGSANDVIAQNTVGKIYWGMDNIASLTDNKLVQGANRYMQDTSSLSKLLQNGAEDLKAVENSEFGKAVKNAYDEAVNKVVGLDEEDRKLIRENKDLVNEYVSKKKNVETLYDDVKNKFDEKISEKIETGKEYEALYKSKKKVVNTEWLTSDKKLMKSFRDSGVYVDENGNLAFKKINDFDAKQQKALQDAWEVLKNAESEWKLNSRETLGQRRKVDNMADWEWKSDKMTASNITTENLIKEMRGVLDARAKKYIPWLKKLDAKYQPMIDEVKQIRKDWFNSDGTIKDNARSKLRNLTKAWNEEKLARLEQLMPWITKDLKAFDVALTVEKVTKQWVWQYPKWTFLWSLWGGAGLWTVFWSPIKWAIAGAVLWVLASPKNYVKLIQVYPDIAQKISAWQELLPSDMDKLTTWVSRVQDGMETKDNSNEYSFF